MYKGRVTLRYDYSSSVVGGSPDGLVGCEGMYIPAYPVVSQVRPRKKNPVPKGLTGDI